MKNRIRTKFVHSVFFLGTVLLSIVLAVLAVEIVEENRNLICESLVNESASLTCLELTTLSATLAQVLAEILAIIIILPQIVLQLSSISYRRDIRDIFRWGTLIYFFIYVMGLILLSFCIPAHFLKNDLQTAYRITFFIFIVLLFLIFPFLKSQIAAYRDPQIIFKPIINKFKKRIKHLSKHPQNDGVELRKLSRDIKDAATDYGHKNREFFQAGIKSLSEIFDFGYGLKELKQNDFLVMILNTIAQIGINIEAVESREFIIEQMLDIQKIVLNHQQSSPEEGVLFKGTKSGITYFTTEIIEVIVQISIQNKQSVYNQTLSKSIETIHLIFDACISSRYQAQVEYHIFTEALRKIALFALKEGRHDACRDAVQIMEQINAKQLKQKLPIPSTSIFKYCESLVDIAILAAQQKDEDFSMVCINRLKEIISVIRRINTEPETLERNLTTVMANFLEAICNIWVLFPAMQDWLRHILRQLYQEQNIKFQDYLKPSREIIAMKSAVSLKRFDQYETEFKSGSPSHHA